MTMVGLPLILFQVEDDDMSDLEFLQTKEDAGVLFSSSVTVLATGISATITPAAGKKFYPTSASFTLTSTAVSANNDIKLQNDGTNIDIKTVSAMANDAKTVPFTNIMRSLVGDGFKVYRINVTFLAASTRVSGSLEGYVV